MDRLLYCTFVVASLRDSFLLNINSVRRRNTTAASDNWYLSGIGQEMAWEGYAPRPGYDARNEDYEPDGDHVVAYTNRYDHSSCLRFLMEESCSVLGLRSYKLNR